MAAFFLGLCLSLIVYQARLDERLPAELGGQVVEISGVIASAPVHYPDLVRFRFEPLRNKNNSHLPGTLLLSWYRDAPALAVGEHWSLEVRLKPPWGSLNFTGPDKERWLFAEGIGALGTVRLGKRLQSAGRQALHVTMQSAVRGAVGRRVRDSRQRAVVQALATADRSGMSREDSRLLRSTGTAHLLAISGLHIGLAALGGMLLGRGLLFLLPLTRMGRVPYYLPYSAAVISASMYALLAGLGVSTLRALLMLLVAVTALATARAIHPWRSYLLALALVLLANPLAPLGAGFWFSFLAVLALLMVFQTRATRLSWWQSPISAQAAVFLLLLPAGAAWFNGFSLVGFIANLIAIPWVSFLVVPPVLLGIVALPVSEWVAGGFWSLAGLAITGLFGILEGFNRVQPHLLGIRSLPLPLLLAALIGALLLLLPRGLSFRWTGVFLLLPFFLPAKEPVAPNALRVDALDVGQGTAITVSSQNHLLLYDTGPGDGSGLDQVASAITPVLTEIGKTAPDLLVISHADLDHSGGLFSFRSRYGATPILASVREFDDHLEPCIGGFQWKWDGFTFRVLHPSAGLPYLRNNSSCVLSITNESAGILLAGDIEDFVEQRLLLENLGHHSVLLTPHHGSNSSSSPAFIDRVAPAAAIATASLGNRFGFPREKVQKRYHSRGIPLWATGECGGLRITIDSQGRVAASSARKERRRIWRWPAGNNCP